MPNNVDRIDQLTQNLTMSVEAFNLVSLTNVIIPKLSDFEDVSQFISRYETDTSTLNDSQKIALLPKAFLSTKYEAWFRRSLEPSLKTSTWSDLKKIILDRFSYSGSISRNIMKLEQMKFDPLSGQKLLDFSEEFIHLFDKVYTLNGKEELCCHSLKVKIPETVASRLNLMPEYRDAVETRDLIKAVKLYDSNVSGYSNQTDKVSHNEMVSILKQLLDKSEANQKQIVAAIETSHTKQPSDRKSRPMRRRHDSTTEHDTSRSASRASSSEPERKYKSNYKSRQTTVGRSNYERSDKYRESRSRYNDKSTPKPDRQDSKIPSTSGYDRSGDKFTPSRSRKDSSGTVEGEVNPKLEAYFETFGKPPGPCYNCGGFHWMKHCPLNLKE